MGGCGGRRGAGGPPACHFDRLIATTSCPLSQHAKPTTPATLLPPPCPPLSEMMAAVHATASEEFMALEVGCACGCVFGVRFRASLRGLR